MATGGNVGGFTSLLELKVEPTGFTQAKSVLDELFNQLKKIKDLAGNLNNMKLTVKIDNGEQSESQRNASLSRQKERELRERGLMPVKLNRNSINPSKSIAKHNRELEEVNNEDWKRKNQKQKESTKNLNDFATALKWVAGILLSFKAVQEIKKSLIDQQETLNTAQGFDTSAKNYYDLQNVGGVFGNDRNAFNQGLSKLQGFQTNPTLQGDLDKQLAIGLKTGAGINVDSEFIKNSYEQNLKKISDSLLKRINSPDATTRRNALEFAKQFGGESYLNTLLGINRNGAGNINGAIGTGQKFTVGVDFSASSKILTDINETFLEFKNQLDHFVGNLSENIASPMKRLNDFLSANKEGFQDAGDSIGDILGIFASLLTGDLGNISYIIKKRKDATDKRNSQKYSHIGKYGFGTKDINGDLDKLDQMDRDATALESLQKNAQGRHFDSKKLLGYEQEFRKTGNLTGPLLDYYNELEKNQKKYGVSKSELDQLHKSRSDILNPITNESRDNSGSVYNQNPISYHPNIQNHFNIYGNVDYGMSEKLRSMVDTSYRQQMTKQAMFPGSNSPVKSA